MDDITGCFRMTTCDKNSANQNITAYGVLLFVSNLFIFKGQVKDKYDDRFKPSSQSVSMGLCILANFG